MRNLLIQFGIIVLILVVLTRWEAIVRWFRQLQESLFNGNRHQAQAPKPLRDDTFGKRYAAYAEEVSALSLEEARQRAEPILADSRFWRCTPADESTPSRVQELGKSLCDLFTRFAVIEETYGEARLSREEIASYEWRGRDVLPFGEKAEPHHHRYLRIGSDPDGNPVVTRAGEEAVYVVYKPLTSGGKPWSASYASVYHWILIRHFYQTEQPDNVR